MPKLRAPLSPVKRSEAEKALQEQLQNNEVSIGEAVRRIRKEWLGISQSSYARMVGVSATTLGLLERDDGRATMETLQRVLKPLGYRLTIAPIRHPK